MFCTKCGAYVSDDKQFCTHCGAPTQASSSQANASWQDDRGPAVSPVTPAYVPQQQPGQQPPKKVSASTIVAIIAAIVIVVAAGIIAFVLLAPHDSGDKSSGASSTKSSEAADDDSDEGDSASTVSSTASSTGATSSTSASSADTTSSKSSTSTSSTSSSATSSSMQDRIDSPSGYVLPDSSTRVYSSSELSRLDNYTLFLARNEMSARYGRKFVSEELQRYFGGKTWYKGTIEPGDFNDNWLNDTERANAQAMLEIEKSRNSPYV